VLGEWGLMHYFRPDWYRCDPTAYAAVLMNAYVRSQTVLYSGSMTTSATMSCALPISCWSGVA
jgi:hypothetical protein